MVKRLFNKLFIRKVLNGTVDRSVILKGFPYKYGGAFFYIHGLHL